MAYLTVCLTAVVLTAGFMASFLPGLGIDPLWVARLRLAGASGFREHMIAIRKVVVTTLLMTTAGVLRLGAFVLGAAMIFTETLIERSAQERLDMDDSEVQGEITNGG